MYDPCCPDSGDADLVASLFHLQSRNLAQFPPHYLLWIDDECTPTTAEQAIPPICRRQRNGSDARSRKLGSDRQATSFSRLPQSAMRAALPKIFGTSPPSGLTEPSDIVSNLCRARAIAAVGFAVCCIRVRDRERIQVDRTRPQWPRPGKTSTSRKWPTARCCSATRTAKRSCDGGGDAIGLDYMRKYR